MKYTNEELIKMIQIIYHCGYGSFDLNMNDTFGYSCSNSEELDLDNWLEVSEMHHLFGVDGVNAWTAIKRGHEVIPPLQSSKYWAAKSLLIKNNNGEKNE